MNKGWIKLWRKILDNPIFKDDGLYKCFTYCLLRANHEGRDFLIKDQVVHCEPGQFVTGRNTANEDLGWKSHRWDDKTKFLEKHGFMDRKTDKLYTQITIINWHIYQGEFSDDGQQDGQVTDNRRTSDGQPTDTNKNVKNVKNVKKISYNDHFLKFWEAYPNKSGKFEAFKAWKKWSPDLEVILKAIQAQTEVKKRLKAQNQFCPEWPNGSTWLNSKRWEDEGPQIPDKDNSW